MAAVAAVAAGDAVVAGADLLIGTADGSLLYFERDGSGMVERTESANPYAAVQVGRFSAPVVYVVWQCIYWRLAPETNYATVHLTVTFDTWAPRAPASGKCEEKAVDFASARSTRQSFS